VDAYYVRKTILRQAPAESVRDITRDQAIEFYRTEFWLAAGCNKIPAEIAPAVFDFAVNSGVRRALAYYKLLKLQGHEQGVALRRRATTTWRCAGASL
jgi:lysozyme family protein